jgi:hypothetical protein
MKNHFTLAFTLLLTASLAQAQAGGGTVAGKIAKTDKKITKTPSAASKVSLNPQPLPPGERKAGGDPASKVSLNPQPLPPGERKAGGDPASKVSLNPQPLPPKQGKIGDTSRASKVSLNPQPLPPKQGKIGDTSRASKVSLNPQPLPPKQGNVGASQKAFTGNKAGKKIMIPGNPTRQR